MEYRCDLRAGQLTFWLKGRLTFRDAELFQELMGEMGAQGVSVVRLDMTELEYVDSFGIGLIVLARDTAEQVGARLELANARGAVDQVMRQIAFDVISTIGTDNDLCISPLRGGADEVSVALAGNFRVKDQSRFLPVIKSAVAGEHNRLIIDLERLSFIDSIGVSLLMTAADEARKAGKELMLRKPQGAVRDLLSLTAVDTVIPVI